MNFGENEGHTIVQIPEVLMMELDTLWREGRDLNNCTNHVACLIKLNLNFHLMWKDFADQPDYFVK